VTTPSGSERIVVDSSGWLEYLTDDHKQGLFAPYLESTQTLFMPTVVLYEVRKSLMLHQGRSAADTFYSEALKHIIVPLDETLAVFSVDLSLRHKLPMADAIIYATAQRYKAQLITSDSHFAGLDGVSVL
jgi:toxin FitB